MKFKSTIKVLAALATMGVFTACNNSDDQTTPSKPLEISIAKPADFNVFSGGRTIVKSEGLSTRAGVEGKLLYFKKADCPDLYRENFPDQKLDKPECDHVYACIKEGATYEVDKNTFDSKAFYIVNAYSSKDHDAMGGHSDVAGDMHDLELNGVKIKEFNTNTCVAADLVLAEDGLQEVTYYDSFGEKKGAYPVTDWKLYYIPDYGYYVGMNYHSTKTDAGDGDYSDWVVKLIPAVKKEVSNDQVEVNLSVNDEHETGDFIATKLSIHVRAITDVEIFIPVDKKYYCEADDMDISLSHKAKDVIYNTEPKYVSKQIGSTTVTFKVEYEDAGIRVTTDGINKEVIDFCAETYADGITFEVWNYFKDITRQDLKPMLDQATVTFLDQNVAHYINAFAKINGYNDGPIYNKFNDAGQLVPYTDEECTKPLDQKYWTRETPESKDYIFIGTPNPWDCTVKPVNTSYKKHEPDTTDPTLTNYNVEYTL